MDIANKYTGEVFTVFETIIEMDDTVKFLIYDAHDGWILVDANAYVPFVPLMG